MKDWLSLMTMKRIGMWSYTMMVMLKCYIWIRSGGCLLKTVPSLQRSSKKKNKVMDAFKENKESSDIYLSSMIRSKRAPRKSTKQRRKKLEYLEVERPEDHDDISDSEDEHEHEDLTFSKVDTLDSGQQAENRFSDPRSEDAADVSGLVEDDEAELSDDMPLSAWKSQVRRPNESK
ncbi:uncharacterized protein LOC143564472 [Bidens hawaiensis]|uniref:uncharacterized protein LOC143564472 n=1 Tax=Bidens hawaiensis TaxID=980011 RepID=UPI00404B7CB4